MTYHKPVLLEKSVDGLNIKPEGIYVDLTFGGGGHSKEILRRLEQRGRLFVFDQDADAILNVPEDPRVKFIHSNFRYFRNFLRYYEIEKTDGIIADLGISSHQVDEEERGFTFMKNASLDMRMNKEDIKKASDILNDYSVEDLIRIFREYGDLSNARKLSEAIIKTRTGKRLHTSEDLKLSVEKFLPRYQPNKILAKIFQALRIEVNDELEALKEMLMQTGSYLAPGGRLVVLTYHSAEDRIVKNYMKSGNTEGIIEKDFFGNFKSEFRLLNKSVIVPSEDEIYSNPRARSAKLRIAEKL